MFEMKFKVPFNLYTKQVEAFCKAALSFGRVQDADVQLTLEKGNFDYEIWLLTSTPVTMGELMLNTFPKELIAILKKLTERSHSLYSQLLNYKDQTTFLEGDVQNKIRSLDSFAMWIDFHPLKRKIFETKEEQMRRFNKIIPVTKVLETIDSLARCGYYNSDSVITMGDFEIPISAYIAGLTKTKRIKVDPLVRKILDNAGKIHQLNQTNEKLIYSFSLEDCK